MLQKIGILGGTFNPIHYGHLAAAEEVRDRLRLDRVLFIPSFQPPHKPEEEMPSAAQRQEMVRLAIAGNPSFAFSDVEIRRGGKSYTIETIEALSTVHRDAELYFITGLDSFLDIRLWKDWELLLTRCRFVVLSRPGYRFGDLAKIEFLRDAGAALAALDRGEELRRQVAKDARQVWFEAIPSYEISSTDIRARVREGRSIKYHLPESVEHYIIANKLYG